MELSCRLAMPPGYEIRSLDLGPDHQGGGRILWRCSLFITIPMDDGGVPLHLPAMVAVQETPQEAMDGVTRLLAERVSEIESMRARMAVLP